jgi:hypothetical protein
MLAYGAHLQAATAEEEALPAPGPAARMDTAVDDDEDEADADVAPL